jgi:hypothetical protein
MEKLGLDDLPLHKYFEQFDLLYELYDISKMKERLKKKLDDVKKRKNKIPPDKSFQHVKDLKLVASNLRKSEADAKSLLLPSFDFSQIQDSIQDYMKKLSNLQKAHKRKELEPESFEVSRLEYEQDLERTRRNLERIQKIGFIYYQDLRIQAQSLLDQLDRAKELRLKGTISKHEYFNLKNEKSTQLDLILKKIKFLTSKILKDK